MRCLLVNVLDGGAYRTGIGIVCKSESFGSPSFRVIDEAEALYFSSTAENVCDLLLGEAWSTAVSHRSESGRRISCAHWPVHD